VKISFFIGLLWTLVISSVSWSSVSWSQKCEESFKNNPTQKQLILNQHPKIKELKSFPLLPYTETQLIQRVFSGEDIRLIDWNHVRENYKTLQAVFPKFDLHLAYKAFATTRALDLLTTEFNAKFEIATLAEFKMLQKAGVAPTNIIFTHPDKDALEISETYKGGVRTFVSDSLMDLSSLSKYAPNANVLIRISTHFNSKTTSKQLDNFDERFGVSIEQAKALLIEAKKLGLNPVGISFHVGSQTERAMEWVEPIKQAARLFQDMKYEGISLKVLDLGGGFPMRYRTNIPQLKSFGAKIKQSLIQYFPKELYPETLIIEPGRFVSASAGVTLGRVINVKSKEDTKHLLVTVSTGKYSAGVTLIGYGYGMSFYNVKKNQKCSAFRDPFVLGDIYGKACASIDKISAEKTLIPMKVKTGDLIVITGSGAYAGEMATSNWCGQKAPTDIIFDSHTGLLIFEGPVGC